MSRIRLVSGFLTVGFWTLASRILGFVRDIMIAAFLGAGPVAEAFFVAFSLPNMFRRFLAAAQIAVIDNIIMQKRCCMDKLNRCCERMRTGIGPAAGMCRGQCNHWPEAFATG